ncbi:MAG: PRC-barrel domain-containing protein [Methylobacterium mesophilicum]|nr:PRC-barrel domain-containing protein [Methylobacterium mesophilicum]
MKFSRPLAAAILSAVIATPALAQTAWVKIDDNVAMQPWGATVDAVEDMDVMGANGTKIGEVEEIVGTAAGTPSAIVVDFSDDSPFGNRPDVVVPLDQFTFDNNRLTLAADAATVSGFQNYDD